VKHSFNLISEGWIPVLGSEKPYGIRELLKNAHELGEIACDSPLTTVGVLRILLAILYRACGPADLSEWKSLWMTEQFPAEKVDAYLDKHEDKFDLFGEKPFFQVSKMQMNKCTPFTKLASELSTEGQKLLFEWQTTNGLKNASPAMAALRLIEMQCFGLGGGISADPVVDGETIKRPNFEDGPVARSISIWLTGKYLFHTLMLNMVPYSEPNKKNDLPCWEQDNIFDRLELKASGPLDRFTWQSRLILLEPETNNDQLLVRNMYFAQGRKADKDWMKSPDPMNIYYVDKKDGISFLRLNEGKSAWRDIHALLALDTERTKRNPIFANAAILVREKILPHDFIYNLNVVGMVTDQASISIRRHDKMSLPASLFVDEDLLQFANVAIQFSEVTASEINTRMRAVGEFYLPEKMPSRIRSAELTKFVNSIDSRPCYWSRLENAFTKFILALPRDDSAALQEWKKTVVSEAEVALREACEKLGNSTRAIRATAQISYKFYTEEKKK
jgi:CRISPR system Cascade subunit CasA